MVVPPILSHIRPPHETPLMMALCVKMISETNDIEPVRPLFERYMWHMKQYFEIEDVEAWLVRANEYFNLYQVEPERKVYIFTAKEKISGFALVNSSYRFNTIGSVIAEFYIAPEQQNKGHGQELAKFAFAQRPGMWEVCVASGNISAYKFWNTAISEFTNGKYKIHSSESYDGKGFSFNSA